MKKTLSLLVATLATLFLLAGCEDTSGGVKIGSITNITRHSGVFCDTWEAEIISSSSGFGMMGQRFYYTIKDHSLINEAEKYMHSQQEVKITYKREGITWCRAGNDMLLSKIEPLNAVSMPASPGASSANKNNNSAVSDSTSFSIGYQTENISIEQQLLELIKKQQALIEQLLDERNKQ